MSEARAPWVVACDGSAPEEPFGFMCRRCGTRLVLGDEDILVSRYLTYGKAFLSIHGKCEEGKAGAGTTGG